MFADEARFGRMNRPRPCWAPIGIRPEVACQLIREYVYLYGAVSPKDGTCVYLVMPAPEELAKEFEPSAQAIRNWVAQADRDEGRREDGLTTAERKELNRLRRENRLLKLEREILSKAAAWFARETDVIPPKGFNS
jgi:transposase